MANITNCAKLNRYIGTYWLYNRVDLAVKIDAIYYYVWMVSLLYTMNKISKVNNF